MKLRKFNEKNYEEEKEEDDVHVNHDVDQFVGALEGLIWDWGGDTPPEVYWGLNRLLDWYEGEYNVHLPRFDEENPHNNNDVLEAIRNA